MKKLLLLFMAFATVSMVNAQVKTPAPSPFSKVEQKVGLTDVTLEYSRPSVKGRTVFGDLVPYGKIWRTGANARTKITFSTDVTVGGTELKAGSYSIFSIPTAESWEVIFYNDGKQFGTPSELDAQFVAAKATGKAYPIPFSVETFTIDLNNLTNSGARLEFIWEKTWVGIDIEVPTDKGVMASIKNVMSGPGANDYFQSAVYFLQEGKDIKKAQKWIDKAVEMTKDQPRFWFLRQQSLIHAKAGDKAGAIAAAKKSLAGAEAAGNADYVKMNKDSLKEWGAL
ncbi:DUF2911 domain-containing protein [Seonamhaeicola maritimus]|uniref:DUF2911 domain-containing protein n=1 Tax=Seonamhaeicola maritimus TaxID=2591822 RepID=A0A5C7GGD0_9FLAO|nr:DUF2911 domain-containing protein [Seonamhaeicola maritimus]TXG35757.1 DUF2911 domain-containing protein [Seonamhaeicola maritimus]